MATAGVFAVDPKITITYFHVSHTHNLFRPYLCTIFLNKYVLFNTTFLGNARLAHKETAFIKLILLLVI